MGKIGTVEILLIGFVFILIPFSLFFLGYFFGKKSGYLKRIKEEKAKE